MVAVKAWEADRYLAAPPKRVRLFLLYGSDAGAITERARLVEHVALQRGGGETVLRIGSDALSTDPGRIADEAYSASLFGGEPVIGLRIQDGRHNVLGAVEQLLSRPPDVSWLVIEAGELAKTSPLLKAFEGASHAAAIPSYPSEASDLQPLIHAAAELAGVIVEPAAMELLADVLSGDRMAARRELEKLFLYVGDHRAVTSADVHAVVGDTAQVRNDELIDAVLLGDNEAVEQGLDRLRAEGGSAAGLAAQALRHLIQLQALRATMETGLSAAAALERAKPPIFSRRRAAVEAELRRWPADALIAARHRLAEAIATTRKQASLEAAAVSEALQQIALQSRRLRRGPA